MNACPAGCGRGVAPGMLLCAPCWHAVPRELQIAVWRTWRAWGKETGSIEALKEYRIAADAATAHARGRVTQRVLPV